MNQKELMLVVEDILLEHQQFAAWQEVDVIKSRWAAGIQTERKQ